VYPIKGYALFFAIFIREVNMTEYKLEIKQLVGYPRCRIYRQFIRNLMDDRSIRLGGCSYLFYYIVLCSFANFRTSYRRMEGITYTIYPGEWVCRISDIMSWFRTKYQYQAFSILVSYPSKTLNKNKKSSSQFHQTFC
jgi:hypothetical protein